MKPTADEIIKTLGLTPHTCGYVTESYLSKLEIPANVIPSEYEGSRPLGDVLYFLVTPEAPVQLHRIRSDQMYHHYFGGTLEVLLLYPDGKSEVKKVGSSVENGVRPQLFIPGGTFHTARVEDGADYSLLATSVWLKALPPDVEMGDPEKLMAQYPSAAEEIKSFSGKGK